MEQQATSPPTRSPPLPQNELPDSLAVENLIDRTALGDRVPFMLRSREMAAFVATLSPEEQEAFEVELAQQQEALWLREKRRERHRVERLSAATIRKPVALTFLDLPPEILRHILFHLPFTSVAICQRVNRHLHVLISQSTDLQYYVHLGISGLVDNPRNDLAVSERLSLLLARERRWDELDFDFHKVVDVTFPFKSAEATLSAGVFGGLAPEKCRYMRIPSAATEEVKWREVRTEQTIVSVVPGFHEPDLHVLITAQPRTVYTDTAKPSTIRDVRVHLNQLSTGEPHPDVLRAIISFETRNEFETLVATMRCAGDNMVLVLQDFGESNRPEDQVLVYDWRTGELKLSFSAPGGSYYYPLFLTTHLFLLPNTATGNLEYWRIPQSPSELTLTQPFFLLSLPRLCSGNAFHSIACLAEPNPGPCNASMPFYTNPENAIAAFYVHIMSAGLRNEFRLFIHRNSLVRCLDQLSVSNSFGEPPEPVPYDQWGPPVCRWFHDDPGQYLETMFGQKYIAPPPPTETEGAPLTLLDFNPINVAKALAAEDHLKATGSGEGDWSSTQIEDDYYSEGVLLSDNAEKGSEYKGKVAIQSHEASGLASGPLANVMETYDSSGKPRPRSKVVTQIMDPLNDPEGCFEHIVYSSLPYVVHSSQDKYRYYDCMLGEESIVGVRVDDEENVEELHVLHCG
ncbi:hypothetical protein P691DRAFT_729215 [Macrolepiota fuliginosa MF-IS2]|uniref:F-box domain-containing protein n=1 Tax=Macrolepiota fuliginosa MF-IS2 TaxID=1400762 RepID=A0A9P6C4R9_9AGAR|nr:hypothetical protein P691DRAFT_729215 [Macrolepiota fuliginosa MF-IS2]